MKKLTIFLGFIALVWGFIWFNNNWILTTEYTVAHEALPEAFEGSTIVQISDLHNASFGDEQENLIEKVKAADPEAIFLTGDLIDSNRYDLDVSLTLVEALVRMGDVFYVIGNHEVASNKIDEITSELEKRGVQVLMNETVTWEKEGEAVEVAGIVDPLLGHPVHEDEFTWQSLQDAELSDDFTLLLAHRPEFLKVYAEEQVEVVFSGHAHGGQVRMPGLGGLIAPGQGWFPAMTQGVFERDNTQLVLSRGLGNSTFPLRLFNFPEIVVVTLEKE